MRPRFTMSVALDSRLLAGLVDAYARHNLRLGYLPPLLRSGVRYDDKGAGSVHWLDASELLAVGRGDCKALTAYALAELWRSGVDPGARAEVCGARALSDAVKRRGKRRRKRKPMVHVYVRLSDGAIWDPSVALGMRPLPRKAYAMSDDTFNHETAELAANTRDTGAELAGLDADELVGGGEAALGGDDDGAGLYDDNDVAQLAGAIEDYNRQTGLALGADDAADEYQAPAPAPVVPQPPTVDQATASPYERNEPTRGRARKAKPKRKWYQSQFDDLVTWESVLQSTAESYARAIQGGVAGGGRSTRYTAPPMGSRTAQRGYVDVTGKYSKQRTVAPGGMAVGTTRVTGAAASARARPPGATILNPQPTPGEFDPKWGEELEPAVSPGGLEPVQVPKREKFSDLYPVEVPERVKYGQPGAQPGTGTAKDNARAGSRPGTAMPGTGRSTGSGTRPGTGRTPTSRRTPGIPRTTAGAPVLSLDALLGPVLRSLTRRTAPVRNARPGIGATSPGTGTRPGTAPQTQPQPDPLMNYPGRRTSTDECECPKKKKSKPRTPRSQCWKGSYVETAKGLKKTRREQVPC